MLLISCICGIVLVELKLLQVLYNKFVKKKKVVLKYMLGKKKKKKNYSSDQKAPLKVHIL